MSTKQPVWQFVANLGDRDPLNYSGFFVYVDQTGVYDPKCVLLERITDDSVTGSAERWQVWRFDIPRCTDTNGIVSDNCFHPDHPAWFAKPESERTERPQDTTYLRNVCESNGITETELRAMLCASDPVLRAYGYRMIGDYHGFDNFDNYPKTFTRKDLFRHYRKECFPRSVHRTGRKVARNVPSCENGPFAIASV